MPGRGSATARGLHTNGGCGLGGLGDGGGGGGRGGLGGRGTGEAGAGSGRGDGDGDCGGGLGDETFGDDGGGGGGTGAGGRYMVTHDCALSPMQLTSSAQKESVPAQRCGGGADCGKRARKVKGRAKGRQ